MSPSLSSVRSESPNWIDPAPTSASASATAMNSSPEATLAGSTRPSRSMWRRLRSDESPRAPATIPSRTIAFMSSICSPDAASVYAASPITWRRTAEKPMSAPTLTPSRRSSVSRYSGMVSQVHSTPASSDLTGMASTRESIETRS